MELFAASRQWASRPADERFISLYDLQGTVHRARHIARERTVSSRRIEFTQSKEDEKAVSVRIGDEMESTGFMSHWSFGQMASLVSAPASYLRTLHPALVADCLNYGMKFKRDAADVGLLIHDGRGRDSHYDPANVMFSAATGPNYGRIWNVDIIDALVKHVGDGVTGTWKVPGEFGRDVPVTKENTTIYGSDRDMFVFLADEKNRVEITNRRAGRDGSLARGFFIWNSEVGNQSFGIGYFLFDYACSNRIVWGARDYKEIRIRHTASAPDKWMEQAIPALEAYSQSAAAPIEQTIKAAQEAKLKNDVEDFLKNRQFTLAEITNIKAAHEEEEGRPMETLWDVTTGVTAYAKRIKNTDTRVGVERKGGAILDLVAA